MNNAFNKVKTFDPVNSPRHYADSPIEVIDALEAWKLDESFCLGNVVKYIARAGKKDPAKTLEDLKKAQWYLNREISKREKRAAKMEEARLAVERLTGRPLKRRAGR